MKLNFNKYIKRTNAFLLAGLFAFTQLMLPVLLSGTASATALTPSYTESWDGRGKDSLACNKAGEGPRDASLGWIHWIFSTKGESSSASLTLGGSGTGQYTPAEPLNANTWHFFTPFSSLDTLTATINLYGGEEGQGGGLVISDYCPAQKGGITIKKMVDLGNGYVHDNPSAYGFVWGLNNEVPARAMGTTASGLVAGTYSVSENEVPGYVFTGWYYTGSTHYSCSYPKSTTFPTGIVVSDEARHITLCNKKLPKGKVKLVKYVKNNSGGQLTPNDFGLTIGGQSVTSGQEIEFTAGTNVALNEVGAPGYRFVSITGDEECPTVLGGTVTVKANTTITCTIKNDDNKTKLTLVKKVVNDNGGSATASDFVPALNEVDTTWGAHYVQPGSYTVTETMNVGGYKFNGITCYLTGTETVVAHPVSLTLGQDVTCTVENNDIAPIVKVKKYAPQDAEKAFAFALHNKGSLYAEFSMSHGGTYNTGNGLKAGNVSVSETVPSGWRQAQAYCYNKQEGSLGTNFIAKLGQSYKCKFVNEKLAEITVVKDAQPNHEQDFSFNLTQFVDECEQDVQRVLSAESQLQTGCEWPEDRNTASGVVPMLNGFNQSFVLDDDADPTLSNTKTSQVVPGVYTVTEDQVEGWDLDDISCGNAEVLEKTATSVSFAVASGQKVTCTFVNKHVTTPPQVLGETDEEEPAPHVLAAQTLADTGEATTIYNSVFAFTIALAAVATGLAKRKETHTTK